MFYLIKGLTAFMVGTTDSMSKRAERVFVLRNLTRYNEETQRIHFI